MSIFSRVQRTQRSLAQVLRMSKLITGKQFIRAGLVIPHLPENGILKICHEAHTSF